MIRSTKKFKQAQHLSVPVAIFVPCFYLSLVDQRDTITLAVGRGIRRLRTLANNHAMFLQLLVKNGKCVDAELSDFFFVITLVRPEDNFN